MKPIKFVILIFLILLPTIASAAYKYIKVDEATNENRLWAIKSELNNIGLTMIFNKTNSAYIVYSGPYKSDKSAHSALKLIKKSFPHAKIVTQNKKQETLTLNTVEEDANTTIDKGVNTTIEDEAMQKGMTIEESITIKEEDYYDGFFVGASLGISYSPYSHDILSGVVIINNPNKYAFSYSIEGGYTFQNNISISLEYLKSSSSDISMDNIMGSVNYMIEYDPVYVPYFGVSIGHSILTRESIPLYKPQTIDKQSQSLISGVQFGVLYKEYDLITPYISYQFISMNHAASLKSSTGVSRLEHNSLHNIQVGVRF